MLGAVNHDGGEAVVHAFFADFEVLAVVQMQGDIKSRIQNCCLHQL